MLLGAYLCALVYGSLYPWTGWQASGGSALSFISDGWPRYWTAFDLLANLLLYAPLGALCLVSMRDRAETIACMLGCGTMAFLLSLSVEALQHFMPGRVPSLADLIANTAGALSGALAMLVGIRLAGARSARLSSQHWVRSGAMGPALLIAWVVMQLHPQRLLFGHGDIVRPLTVLWQLAVGDSLQAGSPPALRAEALADSIRLHADYAVFVEASGTGCAIVALGLLVREVFPRHLPRSLITALLVIAGGMLHAMTEAALVGSGHAFAWLSAGAQGGMLTGVLLLAALATAQRRTRLAICVAALVLTCVLTSILPLDAYYRSALGRWDHGAWRNLTGLLQAANLIWPLTAIAWCGWRLSRPGRDLGTIIRGR
ncbi:MAG: VanZ family protein [Quisquiliibacterium sp.]